VSAVWYHAAVVPVTDVSCDYPHAHLWQSAAFWSI